MVCALWLGFSLAKNKEREKKKKAKTTEGASVSKSSLQPGRKPLSVACHRLLRRELAQVI